MLKRCFSTATSRERIVFSGIQPTGHLHIGNYLGAVKNWRITQQDDSFAKKIFCIGMCINLFTFSLVDMHAITVPQDPKQLSHACFEQACALIACGLDPAKCSLYFQSHVPAHAELSWIFSCTAPVTWLRHMIQFKVFYKQWVTNFC